MQWKGWLITIETKNAFVPIDGRLLLELVLSSQDRSSDMKVGLVESPSEFSEAFSRSVGSTHAAVIILQDMLFIINSLNYLNIQKFITDTNTF